MPNANLKQRILNRMISGGRKESAEPGTRPVLDQLLYAVCREGTTKEQADKAFKALQTSFFDWNEVRVSMVREVADVLRELPEAETRATRIIAFLQEIFETTYSFDLDSLHKKGLKQAEKQLERYQGATPFVVAYTVQHGLGGHALPIDQAMRRALLRLHLLEDVKDSNVDGVPSTGLEHLVPKARGPHFCDMVSSIAHGFCHERSPNCSGCVMNDLCPSVGKFQKPRTTERSAARARSR